MQADERRRDMISAIKGGAVAITGFGVSLITSTYVARQTGNPSVAETAGLIGIGVSMAWGVGNLIRLAYRNTRRNQRLDAVADIPLLEVTRSDMR
jgi:hypothetical protein